MDSLLVGILLASATLVIGQDAPICEKCDCIAQIPSLVQCKSLDKLELPLLENEFNQDTIYELKLEGLDLAEIQALPNISISKVSFHDNAIDEIVDGAFQNVRNLTEIDLSKNKLIYDSLRPNTFLGQFNEDEYLPLRITVLRLGYNNLHSIDKDVFDHLAFLEVLELNDNPIKILDHQTSVAITTLRNLKVLNLASTGISKIPEGFLHALPKLSSLILANNKFASSPSELENAKALEYLNLNNNPIITFQRGDFKGLEELRELNISAMNELTSIDGEAFGPLKSLEVLRCSFNPNLSSIASDAFFGIGDNNNEVRLKEVHFRGNDLQYLNQYMLPWETMDIIDIEENPWRCDCHLRWMINSLVNQISEKTPDLTLSLTCKSPAELTGRSLVTLGDDEQLSRCKMVSIKGMRGQSDGSASLLAVGILGIALCVLGTVAFVVILIKRNKIRKSVRANQQVRYVRARLEDAFEDRPDNLDYSDEPKLFGDEKKKCREL